MYKVLGLEKYEGSYEGKKYSGTRLYLQYPDSYLSENLKGKKIEIVKVPSGVDVSGVDVGKTVQVYYNKYGRVDAVILV